MRIEFPSFSVLVVVPHGPYMDDPKVQRSVYWKQVTKQVDDLKLDGEHVAMLTDANAQVHSCAPKAIEHAGHFTSMA